jgi:cyanophycinase-like exopeptidase
MRRVNVTLFYRLFLLLYPKGILTYINMMGDKEKNMHRREALKRAGAGFAAIAGMGASIDGSWADGLSKAAQPFKGKLILIGGAITTKDNDHETIDKIDPYSILRRVAREVHKQSGFEGKTVIVVTNASDNHASDHAIEYQKEFKKLGAGRVITVSTPQQAASEGLANIVKENDTALVFFGGGDQRTLVKEFKHTPAFKAMQERFIRDKDFTVAGTSAGAAAMAKKMIYENKIDLEGFGLIDMPVDTHVDHHRIGKEVNGKYMEDAEGPIRSISRVHDSLVGNDLPVGVALEECSGVVIDGEGKISAFGEGSKSAHFVMKANGKAFALKVGSDSFMGNFLLPAASGKTISMP